jgi:hypothetical protein
MMPGRSCAGKLLEEVLAEEKKPATLAAWRKNHFNS